MKLEELKKTKFHCSFLECHKQSWQHDSRWTGYGYTPRPNYAFILVCSDMKMEFRLQSGKIIEAKKGDLVFVPKGTVYIVSFFHTSKRFDSYTVNFLLSDEACRELVLEDEPQVFKYNVDDSLPLLAENCFQSYLCRDTNRIKVLSHFYSFLDVALTLTSYNAECYYPIKIGAELLIREWNENKKIEYYAKQCRVHKSYFYKLFKAWSGVSPTAYRNRLRVTAAKDLLAHTNLPVCEIARKTGFDDPYYFSRLFKKEIGLSPVQYKKQNRPSLCDKKTE